MSVKRRGEGVSEVSGQIPLSVTKWIFGRPLTSQAGLEKIVIWPRVIASEINLKVQAASRLKKAARDAKSTMDHLFSHARSC